VYLDGYADPCCPLSFFVDYSMAACANGEVAPFMGHNAFLRWKAIQDAAFIDPADGKEKIWSESNVSEDFDMALRLLLRGYIIRWATYSNGGFKEGVSLTVDDELNRWQKYAYGEGFCVAKIRCNCSFSSSRLQRTPFPPAHPVVETRSRDVPDPQVPVVQGRPHALQDLHDGLCVFRYRL
jgi:hypothetical protein